MEGTPEIKLDQVNNLLLIKNHELLGNHLYESLSYIHKTFGFGYMQSKQISTKKVKCYGLLNKYGDNVLVTKIGFLDRIMKLCQKHNIKYTYTKKIDNADKFEINEKIIDDKNLRGSQATCLKAIADNETGIVVAATGFGKSFLIPRICKMFPKATIDVVCKRKDVTISIYRECIKEGLNPAIVTSGYKRPNYRHRVTIYTAGSLKHSTYDADILLVDECHELVTTSYITHIFKYNNARLYGFTATPNTRYDNAHFLLEMLFGKNIFSIDFREAVNERTIVPILVQWFTYGGSVNVRNLPFTIAKRVAIWANRRRNEVIANVAKMYANMNKQVLIITSTIEHALMIATHLENFVICCGPVNEKRLEKFKRRNLPIEKIVTNKNNRADISEQFKNRQLMHVIATDVWTTGVSFDDLDVLIRADARTSKTLSTQIPGRVMRIPKLTNKEFGLVVDFCAVEDDIQFAKDRQRFIEYKKHGWTQCNSKTELIKNFGELRQHTGGASFY